jgi:putative nucleotidyltransferase with HDIG domain
MTYNKPTNLPTNKVAGIIESIDSMRPLPMSVSRVLTVMDESQTTAAMVANVLGLDQALAANVLLAANSVFLGFGPSCTTLKEAVMRLGFSRIRTLVLGVAAAGTMNTSLLGYSLAAGDLYNHAVATATAAQWFARSLSYPEPEEAYIAGLLHDMGKITLDKFARKDHSVMKAILLEKDMPIWQIEQKYFGIDHAEIGYLMSRKWTFPGLLSDAIRNHHHPSESTETGLLPAIINLANFYSPVDETTLKKLGMRSLAAESTEILKITPQRLETLTIQMIAYYRINFSSRQ